MTLTELLSNMELIDWVLLGFVGTMFVVACFWMRSLR